jgi:sugar O-acyltransferase (sialic acid O-acetyltransferase NeuD family)
MPEPLIVFGSGGHAKVVIEAALARDPEREIVILDDAAESKGRAILGIAVAGGRDELPALSGIRIVPAIGDNQARSSLVRWLREQGRPLETIVHPAAFVGVSARIGEGVFVSAGAIVIAEARVGDGAIVNTGATVDHDCDIGEAAHVGPGAHLCGNVRVGARCLVGVGSCIRPGISVCDDVVLGAGSVVVRDIAEPGTYAGNPARRLG